jgi:hypothetical protein
VRLALTVTEVPTVLETVRTIWRGSATL